MIRFDSVVKRFNVGTPDETTLFDHFTFDVEEGEFVSIVGSNGSGKTTLLNLLCGSLPLDGGRLLFRNRDITRLSEHKRAAFIGRVFQDPAKGSCPDLTILENMALADNNKGRSSLAPGIRPTRIDAYRSRLEIG